MSSRWWLKWGTHPNWYFGSFGKPNLPLRSKFTRTWHQQWLDNYSSEMERLRRCSSRILLIPPVVQVFSKINFPFPVMIGKCYLGYSIVLLGPSTCPGSFIDRISNCLFKQHEPFGLFSIFLIDLYNFPPPILTPLYHPIPFDLELCLLGSASCERKETSMPSSWPRVSRRMISKPCWAETWTWMRHRGEETGFGIWF